MSSAKYRKLFERAARSVQYWRELALTEFTTDLDNRMIERGLNRALLAKKLGSSRAYVTKALRGDANLTLESMVRIAMAVDGVVHVHISDRNAATSWADRPMNHGTVDQISSIHLGGEADARYAVEVGMPAIPADFATHLTVQ